MEEKTCIEIWYYWVNTILPIGLIIISGVTLYYLQKTLLATKEYVKETQNASLISNQAIEVNRESNKLIEKHYFHSLIFDKIELLENQLKDFKTDFDNLYFEYYGEFNSLDSGSRMASAGVFYRFIVNKIKKDVEDNNDKINVDYLFTVNHLYVTYSNLLNDIKKFHDLAEVNTIFKINTERKFHRVGLDTLHRVTQIYKDSIVDAKSKTKDIGALGELEQNISNYEIEMHLIELRIK